MPLYIHKGKWIPLLQGKLLAKGYVRMEGIDFNEVISLFVKYPSTIILLALVAQVDFELP